MEYHITNMSRDISYPEGLLFALPVRDVLVIPDCEKKSGDKVNKMKSLVREMIERRQKEDQFLEDEGFDEN